MTIAAVETTNFGLNHLADAARERGQDLLLLTANRSRYAYELSRGVADTVRVIDIDTTDVDAMVELLTGVPDLAGVARMTDPWSLPALWVAQRLGLPHENPEAVMLLRDKARLRAHLFENGFSEAQATVIDPHTADPEELSRRLPFPCIVKDVAGVYSQNVWLVDRPEDLGKVLVAARASDTLRGDGLTAESYFAGPLYSAETVTWDGETRVLGVSSRGMSAPPHFREETASFPVRFPDQERQELATWISEILASTGYRSGVTHTEFIVTQNGFEIVEINSRIGGALIGESVNRSLGVNFHGAFLDLALGQRPALMDAAPTASRGFAQVAVYAPRTGTFDGIDGAESLSRHPGSPRLYPVLNPDDVVPSTTDQRGVLAALVADGSTAELALHNALSAAGKLVPRMR